MSSAPSACSEALQVHWDTLAGEERDGFRFLQVSTDEVGSLAVDNPLCRIPALQAQQLFGVRQGFRPPGRAYGTYGLPVLTTNCSNNYGPYRFPRSSFPRHPPCACRQAAAIYGDGLQVGIGFTSGSLPARSGECSARRRGETYNIGVWNEKTNLEVVEALCALLDELRPDPRGGYRSQITFMDRPRPRSPLRHRRRKNRAQELGWRPAETFATGSAKP